MRLCDRSLINLLPDLIREPEDSLVNPASIDIRIGRNLLYECSDGSWKSHDLWLSMYHLEPGEFVLVETYEYITVPNGHTVNLYLKSSIARQGYNHSLSFWVDPGWKGVLTMEVSNISRYNSLPLRYGMRFAQIVVDRMDDYSEHPYSGKYQGALTVEGPK